MTTDYSRTTLLNFEDLPTDPWELMCRYMLALRWPSPEYYEAVKTYLERVIGLGIGDDMDDLLNYLEPNPRLRPSRDPVEEKTETWVLTERGVVEAEGLLGRTMRDHRHRRPIRRVLLVMAMLGATELPDRSETLTLALAEASGNVLNAACADPFAISVAKEGCTAGQLDEALADLDGAFATSARMTRRLAVGEREVSTAKCLASMERFGLAKRLAHAEIVRPGRVISTQQVERLKQRAHNGRCRLSPLALMLLRRRMERGIPYNENGPGSDAHTIQRVLTRYLATTTDLVCGIAEQVTLRQRADVFDPVAFRGTGSRERANQITSRRVDAVLWKNGDHDDVPGTFVELERRDYRYRVDARIGNHLQAVVATSATTGRKVELCFVADAKVRELVRASTIVFMRRFETAAAGMWREAEVKVRLIRLGDALRFGLAPAGNEWTDHYYGRTSRAPERWPSPLAIARLHEKLGQVIRGCDQPGIAATVVES